MDTLEAGPAVDGADDLTAWLDAVGEDALVRLPVHIRFAQGILRYIGDAAVGSVALSLDDGAMGEPLMEYLERLASDDEDEVDVWLDGHPRRLVEAPGLLDDEDVGRPFAVRAVHGRVAEGEERRAYLHAKDGPD